MASDWWKSFFTVRTYPLDELTRGRARTEIRELLKCLPVGRGAAILDVACGLGRHSFEMAKQGYRVTGIDYSASYIAQARKTARRSRRAPRFLRRDMRRLGFRGEFDAAVNLFTSFGYFPKFSDDLKTLRSIRGALKPRGWLAMELINGKPLLKKRTPARTWNREGRFWSLEEYEVRGGADPAIWSERIFIAPDGRVSRGETFVRLYTRRRLSETLRRAGFSKVYLSEGTALLGRQSGASRLFALARRD